MAGLEPAIHPLKLNSLALKYGFALLHEGALRLARILGMRELDGHALLETVSVAHRQFLDGVQRALDVADRDRTFRGDLARDVERGRHELFARRAGLDPAQPVELRSRHSPPGQIHGARTRAAHMFHQKTRPACEPDIDLRHRE